MQERRDVERLREVALNLRQWSTAARNKADLRAMLEDAAALDRIADRLDRDRPSEENYR